MLKLWSLIVYLSFISMFASAQQARQYSFTHFTTANGLASNTVNNAVEDERGYIWLATINGLQRYDGNKFLTFTNVPGDPHSVPSENIARIFKDRQSRIWIITVDNKVGIFNTVTFKYQQIPIRLKEEKNYFQGKGFFETHDGLLLLHISYDGFYRLNESTREFVPHHNFIPLPKKWNSHNIAIEPRTNRYWISCDSGLVMYDPATRNVNYRGHNPDKNPVLDLFAEYRYTGGIYIDSLNRFFVITWIPYEGGPLLRYCNMRTLERKDYNLAEEMPLGYHEINGFLHQQNGRLWWFGKPFIAEYADGPDPFKMIHNEYKNEQSIKYDMVHSMYEDSQRNVWICTNNGLFLFNPDAQFFTSYSLLRPGGGSQIEGPVHTSLQFRNGDLWIGCWGVGMYAYDKNLTPIQLPTSLRPSQGYLSVWCMLQDKIDGRVWVGMQSGGLAIYDTLTGKTDMLALPVFGEATIRQITQDKEGNLWFGCQSGQIIKWNRKLAKGNIREGYTKVVKTGLVHKLYTDREGYIWAGTIAHGALKIDPSTGKVLEQIKNIGPDESRLLSETVNDILQYNDSLYIISTGGLNIYNSRTKQVSHITTRDGLPANSVVCMQKDAKGILWLGMINGLCRMNLEKRIFTFYDRRDGISDDNFNVGGAYQMIDGRMCFATDHNFLVFDPKRIMQADAPADVRITEFRLANRALSLDSLNNLERIEIGYDINSMTIEFGSLSYLKQNKIMYYYMLEGLDKEWIPADQERHQAVYNYLAPGNYVFKVRAENGDGISSQNITTLNVKVKPPFWKTWWFYGALVLAGIVVFYLIDKERIRRLLALQQVRTQIATNLHQELNTTLNNINLLSELAKIKVDKDITKSKEFIDQIHEKSRRMIDAMDDMLWSIQPENDSMQKTLERMTEYAEGLKSTHDIHIDMIVDERVKSLQLDMKSRHELFLIYKEALQNITQHSGASVILIQLDLVKSTLSLKINDNGSGYDQYIIAEGAGIKAMKNRAAILNADFDIQSDKKGTSVLLHVPI